MLAVNIAKVASTYSEHNAANENAKLCEEKTYNQVTTGYSKAYYI